MPALLEQRQRPTPAIPGSEGKNEIILKDDEERILREGVGAPLQEIGLVENKAQVTPPIETPPLITAEDLVDNVYGHGTAAPEMPSDLLDQTLGDETSEAYKSGSYHKNPLVRLLDWLNKFIPFFNFRRHVPDALLPSSGTSETNLWTSSAGQFDEKRGIPRPETPQLKKTF